MKIRAYQMIQEYRELGLSQKKVAEKLRLTLYEVRRVWVVTEEEFCRLPQRKERNLDKYRGYIICVLKLSPQIKEANLYYKLHDVFPEFDTTKITFYRYMKKLRQETGYDMYKEKSRLRTMREKSRPGYEGQVDFGQYKMKEMYGINRRIYFFVTVLSYSNYYFTILVLLHSQLK